MDTNGLGDGRSAVEARTWLLEHPDGFSADRFGILGSALQFVNDLYGAGALQVDVGLEPGRWGPNTMRVVLPKDTDARGRIFSILQAEIQFCGEGFAANPSGLDETLITAEVAKELGLPELEGIWLSEGSGLRDIGQEALTLWWD